MDTNPARGTSVDEIRVTNEYLRPKDCAVLLGVSLPTFWRLTHTEAFPDPARLLNGGVKRWAISDLRKFADSARSPKGEAEAATPAKAKGS